MLSLFDVVGHAGTLVLVLCLAGAVAALIYVPSPLKHYCAAALVAAAFVSQIYAEGYRHADDEWQAKYDRQIAAMNDEAEKAVIAAEQKAKAESAANAANLKAQLDALSQQKAVSDADLAAAQALINAAPQDAKPDGPDAPAHSVILDAIRGK